MKPRIFPLLSAIFPFLLMPLTANAFKVLDKALDFSYENIQLPKQEVMGLMGGNYLVKTLDNLELGLGVYGAVRGKRGGFFTGGGQLKSQFTVISPVFLGLEGFIGGGGGGSAPQGGGLMLRGAGFLGLARDKHEFKLGISHIRFPNGDISSNQWSVGYAYRFKSFHVPGWSDSFMASSDLRRISNKIAVVPKQFSFQTSFYFPPAKNKGVSGKAQNKRMDIVGVRYQASIKKRLWFDFETGGGLGGGIDGFAQVFTGINYKLPIGKTLSWTNGFSVGAAGGGDVHTGGGSVVKLYTGGDFNIVNKWILYTQIGFITAPGGDFYATLLNINLGRRYKSINPGESIQFDDEKTTQVRQRKFRIRPGIQNYSSYLKHSRKSADVRNHPVSSVQIKLDSFITSSIFFTGHAIGAFDGKAGGYAVGLVGAGVQFLPYANVELLLGAAGGGGIDVGKGQVVQPMLNLEIPINDAWSIEPGAGYIWAIDGALSSWVTSLGLSYRFSVPGV